MVSFLCLILSVLLLRVDSSHELTEKQLRRQASIIESVEVSSGNRSIVDNYWTKQENLEYYGELVDSSQESSIMTKFYEFSAQFNKKLKRSDDKEALYAVENFFWGRTNGIVLEMGAVDGVTLSESLHMESIGWHRILIEGEPTQRAALSKNVDSLAYSCAICENSQVVHYVLGKEVGGIIEFMSESYLKMFYPMFLSPKSEWKNHEHVKQIQCIPLRWIFRHKRIFHVNFFILDVEGGELQVLKSIDFQSVRFDVISVETDYTDRKYRPPGYVNEITTFLTSQGYRFYHGFGRNSWFVHQFFTPSTKRV